MFDPGAGLRGSLLFAACLLFGSSLVTPAHGAGVGGFSTGAHGAGVGYSGSSVINHGSAGFSIYSRKGVTRVIEGAPSRGGIALPDGRRAQLVDDGRSGRWLLGAPGNHWIPEAGPNRQSGYRRLPGEGR